MTSISIFRDSSGALLRLVGEGHTGYGEEGSDIICAAISVLFQTLVAALVENMKLEHIEYDIAPERGFMSVAIDGAYSGKSDVRAVCNAVIIGLRGVSEAYPSFVSMREVQC